MFAIRRIYLALLAVAALAAIGSVVVPKVSSAIHTQDARDALIAADTAFGHLTVPRDFVVLKSNPRDCALSYPCYRVPRPMRSVAGQLPGILRSAGVHGVGTVRDSCLFPSGGAVPVSCTFGGISHGYQVLAFLGVPGSCTPSHVKSERLYAVFLSCLQSASVVQITPPYIPADSEPWNGGSGWPVN